MGCTSAFEACFIAFEKDDIELAIGSYVDDMSTEYEYEKDNKPLAQSS